MNSTPLLLVLVGVLAQLTGQAQCPTLLDGQGNAVENLTLANCSGGGTIFLSAGSDWDAFTVNWGDGSPAETFDDGMIAGAFLSHSYLTTPAVYEAVLTEIDGCERIVEVVIEEPANASIQIPFGGVTSACAPQAMAFVNSSTDVSPTTVFTWSFGDGSTDLVHDALNAGQTVTHTFEQGTVDCETSVILTAENHCNTLQGGPSTAEFNPILIWDVDDAAIDVADPVLCYPNVTTTVTNATERNCHEQGNNAQRFELWNFGDLDGDGVDEVTDWTPWPAPGSHELTFPGIGTYEVMLVDSSLCGRDTAYRTIQVTAPPVSALNLNGPTTICEDEQLQFHQMATGVQYKWNFGTNANYITTATGHVSYTFQNPGVYDITSVVLLPGATGTSGCTDTSVVTITVLPDPEPQLVLEADAGCGELVTMASAVVPEAGEGAMSYVWNVDGINMDESGDSAELAFSGVGSHVVALTVTNAHGCSGTAADFVTIYPEPTIDFETSAVCEGEATVFTDLSATASGEPITGWHWTFGDGGESYSQNATHVYEATGTYPVSLTVSTSICEATMTASVDVLAAPDVHLDADVLSGCAPLDVALVATSNVEGVHEWVFGDGLALNTGESSSVGHTYSGTLNTPTSHNVQVTLTTPDGCSATDALVISTAPSAQANFTTDLSNACAPFPVTILNTSVGATGYVWDFGDGSETSTATIPAHTYENTSGFMQVRPLTLVAEAANGCHDTLTVNLNVFPEAVFDLALDMEAGCAPVVMELPAMVSASAHEWNFGDGTTSTASAPEHSWVNTTGEPIAYTVAFTGMNAFGCPGTATADLTVNPQPVADFNLAEAAGCSPFSASAMDASLLADQIQWSLPDGTLLGDGPALVHAFDASSTLTLTATDDAGCSDSHTAAVEVFPAASIALDVPTLTDCSPLDLDLTASGPGLSGGTWNFGDGTTAEGLSTAHVWSNPTEEPLAFNISFNGATTDGCPGIASVEVTVNPQPTADFAMSATEGCAPLQVDLASLAEQADDITWTLGDGTELSTVDGTLPAGSFAHFFHETNDLQTASYTLTLTATDDAGCSDTHSETVTVFPKAKFGIVLPFDSACSPLVLDLEAINGAVEGDWDFGDGAMAEGLQVSHSWSNMTGELASHTVTFIGTSSDGCVGTVDTLVHVKPQPVADFSMNESIGCAPFDVTFTNNSLRADTYHWIYGDGHDNDGLTSATHAFTYEGDATDAAYEVTLIAADEWGCTDAKTDSVTVHPAMLAGISGVTEGCAPFDASFDFAGGEAAVIDWDFGNGATASGPNVFPTFSTPAGEATVYDVTVAAMSVHGCTDMATVPVMVHPAPVADLSLSAAAACAGSPVLVFHNPQYADSVILDLGEGTQFTNPDFSSLEISFEGEGERTVSSTLFTDAGCTATATVHHTVHPAAVAAFTAPDPACSPMVTTLQNNVVIPGTTYLWDLGDGEVSDLASPTHLYENNAPEDAIFSVTLTAETAEGCTDMSTQEVVVHGTPVADLAISSQTGCYPLEVNFANMSEGATTGTLSFGTGEIISLSAADTAITHTYFNASSAAVSYTAVLTVANAGGCSATDQVPVTVSAAVEAEFDVIEQGCSPLQAQFVNASFGATQYFWNFGDGAAADVSQPAHTFVNNGPSDTTFVVTLVAVSAAGCADTTSVGVDVYPMPIADFAANPTVQTYPAATVNISNNSTFGNASNTTWNMGDGTIYEGATPPAHVYETWGTYFITATINNGYCSDVASQTVDILAPDPVAAFNGGGEGCAPLLVDFDNQSSHSIAYLWDFGDGSSTTETNPVHVYNTPGVYNVRLIATGHEGTVAEEIQYATVEVYPTAIAAFTASPNQVVAPDEFVYFINGSSAEVTQWLWDFGDGYLSTEPAPVHSYEDPGVYTVSLTVNNAFNCPSSVTVENAVEALPGGFMRFPTAFTPSPGNSGDGTYDPMGYDNDVFHPLHQGIVVYDLRIFNKWGEMIFVSNDPNIGWNGRVNGEMGRQDVYAWRASATFSDGHSVTKAGDVTLIFH